MKTSQARVRRLSPVVWEATQVQARDVLAQRVQALQVDWGGSTWTLTLTPSMACGALDVGDGECCLQCAWASVAWDLVLSQGVVQARIRARYPQVDASEIPEPIAAACLEEAVQSLAAAIESLGYGSARIDQLLQGPAQTRPMAHVFDLRARCGDVVVVARLGTSPLGLSLLADLACGLPPAANDLRVVIGATGLTVATPLDEEGWTMHPDPDVSPSPADQVAIDHLPLRLVFDLGEVAMPLEAVRQLQAGQTIDLGHPLERAVRVRVNGVHIATGELVDIDGHLGVTLTALVRRPQTSAPRITARAGAAPQAHDLPERP